MAGIALLSDLLKTNSRFYSSQSVHSYAAKFAVSASAASIAASKPFAYRAFLGNEGTSLRLAYCDAGAAAPFSAEDYLQTIGSISESILQYTPKQCVQKKYDLELKPLWFAFRLRQFVITSLRSFLMNYMPVMEAYMNAEDEEDDEDIFPSDTQENKKIDLIPPFEKSVLQIIRETSIVTTRRILERVTVYLVSQRTAWKLLKDASKSAMRKAQRGIPTYVYFYRVGRTTFRTHLLVVASQWVIDVVTAICKIFRPTTSAINSVTIQRTKRVKLLGKKVVGATLKGAGSLIFAPIGAAIFATLFRPSFGQWIGCVFGDMVGPIIIVFILEKNNLDY